MFQRSIPHALLASAICCAAGSAAAATLSVTTSSSLSSGSPDTQTYTTANAADLATLHAVSSSLLSYGSSASGSTEASAGAIGMQGLVHVVSPGDNGYPTTGYFLQYGGPNNSGSIVDQLQIHSATLAVGTPVDLLFTLSFAQTVSLSEAPSLYLQGGYYASFAANSGAGGSIQLVANGIDDPNATSSSVVMHSFIGDYVNMTEALSGGVSAEYIDSTERSGQADASVHFYVDGLTAGVSLSADSSHNYATAAAVPEPATNALLLAGAAMLGWVLSRRGRGPKCLEFFFGHSKAIHGPASHHRPHGADQRAGSPHPGFDAGHRTLVPP